MSSPGRKLRDAIYDQFARIGKAASSPKRLELLDLLCQGERTVEALAKEANLTVANASRHLQILRAARLVEAEKSGLFVTYRIADAMVADFTRAIRVLGEHRLAEVGDTARRFFGAREGMEAVDGGTLLERVRQGTVTVIDVRPPEEYRAGHLVGALSMPLKELEARLSELPNDQEIVAYCRGPYCLLAVQAVELLRSAGFRAGRLSEGVQDWQVLGVPIAAGEQPVVGSVP